MNMSLWVRTQLSACDFEYTKNGHSAHDPLADTQSAYHAAATADDNFNIRVFGNSGHFEVAAPSTSEYEAFEAMILSLVHVGGQ